MAKIIGVIPARFNSSRFPGKVLANILGKSLVQRTYENILSATKLDKIVVATDDIRVFDHVLAFGGHPVMTSLECESGTDRMAEVAKIHFPEAEVFVNIQADEPCLHPTVIDKLVEDLLSNPQAMITTPVVKIVKEEQVYNPGIAKCVFDREGRALYFSRAPIPHPHRGAPPAYFRHIGVYCFRRELLLRYAALEHSHLRVVEDLEQLKLLEYGFPIHVSKVEYEGVEVNHPEDIKIVEDFLCANTSLSQGG